MKAEPISVKQRWIILSLVWYIPLKRGKSVDQQKPLTSREIQLLELEILKAFDAFAQKHSIVYHIAYGTLLGAIRHKGFIPWDDDIDLLIARPEYERLLDLLEQEEIGPEFTFGSERSRLSSYPYPYAKIYLKNTVVQEKKFDATYQQTPLWIDIFPLDGVSTNRFARRIAFALSDLLRNLLYTAIVAPSQVRGVQKLAVLLLKPFTRLIGVQRWVHLSRSLARRVPYEHTPLVGNLALTAGMEKETIAKAELKETIELEFEGFFFPAPKNHHLFLTQLYGDYMTLPPVEEQKSHLGGNAYRLEKRDD